MLEDESFFIKERKLNMYLDACKKFYETMKEAKASSMTLTRYGEIRHALHMRSPDNCSELSKAERWAIMSQADNFSDLGLYYLRNIFGKIERVYYVKSEL